LRFKDFAIKEMDESGNGGFVGYAATFDREPDSYGDIIAPQAFDDTLKAWADSGKPVPLLYGHNMDDPDYNIGTAALEADERGLKATASFDDSQKAQRVRELVRAGRLYKMSFAFDVKEEAPIELDDGTKANELRKLDLFEVSVVLVPANQHAEIIEAKARGCKYGMTISKATGEQLQAALDAIGAIEEQAKAAKDALAELMPEGEQPDEEPEEPKADPEEEKPTGDEGEQPEDDEQKAARVLDRLIDLTIN
jgi:HK97 family phage prohead protease